MDAIRAIPYDKNGSPVHTSQFDPVEGEYCYFEFDPFRKHYLRWIRLPKRGRRPMIELNRDRFAVAVYDTNFHLLGESLLPEDLQPDERIGRWLRWFITPEGYYFRNNRTSDTLNDVFDAFDLQFGPAKTDKQLKSQPKIQEQDDSLAIYEEDWARYLKEVQGVERIDGPLLIVHTRRGCPKLQGTCVAPIPCPARQPARPTSHATLARQKQCRVGRPHWRASVLFRSQQNAPLLRTRNRQYRASCSTKKANFTATTNLTPQMSASYLI